MVNRVVRRNSVLSAWTMSLDVTAEPRGTRWALHHRMQFVTVLWDVEISSCESDGGGGGGRAVRLARPPSGDLAGRLRLGSWNRDQSESEPSAAIEDDVIGVGVARGEEPPRSLSSPATVAGDEDWVTVVENVEALSSPTCPAGEGVPGT